MPPQRIEPGACYRLAVGLEVGKVVQHDRQRHWGFVQHGGSVHPLLMFQRQEGLKD
jgi:hypothetical protein